MQLFVFDFDGICVTAKFFKICVCVCVCVGVYILRMGALCVRVCVCIFVSVFACASHTCDFKVWNTEIVR